MGEEQKDTRVRSEDDHEPAGFRRFMAAYPRRRFSPKVRAAALDLWVDRDLEKHADQIVSDVRELAARGRWANGKGVQHPKNYLNDVSWPTSPTGCNYDSPIGDDESQVEPEVADHAAADDDDDLLAPVGEEHARLLGLDDESAAAARADAQHEQAFVAVEQYENDHEPIVPELANGIGEGEDIADDHVAPVEQADPTDGFDAAWAALPADVLAGRPEATVEKCRGSLKVMFQMFGQSFVSSSDFEAEARQRFAEYDQYGQLQAAA